MNGQEVDTTSFHYQRMYQRLQAKGYSSQEIKKQIALADSLNTVEMNRQHEEELENFSVADTTQYTTYSVCEDIPATEKAVLFALKNSLNLGTWAASWDFSQPVTSWNQTTQTGWKGIHLQGCNVHSIIISYTAIGTSNFIPDLTNLTELRSLIILPTNGYLTSTPNTYKINSNSNFSSIGNLTKLLQLHINDADFGGALPISFSNLSPTIQHFSLHHCNLNDLGQLDSVISTYTELRYLNLSSNYNSSSIADFPLPLSFSYLSNLEIIHFTRSKLSNIDVISTLNYLKVIDFQSNNINQLFPNVSNNVNLLNFGGNVLFDIMLNDNEIFGTIPTYFEDKNVRHFRVAGNNLSGQIPTLNFNNYNGGTFTINNNNFRFNDFRDDFNYYNSTSHLQSFLFSPQAKINNEINLTRTIGQQVSMTMFEPSDTNFHPLDTYQWKKNATSIPGANSKTYSFIAQPDSGGVYTCESYHYNPPMTNSSPSLQNRNLKLVRNKITLNIVSTPPPCIDCTSFDLLLGEKYIISGWVKEAPSTGVTQNNMFTYQNSAIAVSFTDVNGNLINSTQNFVPTGAIIDGWQQIRGEFIVPTNVDDMKIELVNNSTQLNSFFDDIRVHPFNGNLKSFVYDQATQKLMAELDENNYATFYEYDKEGGLVRVKKETEKGVYTIQETRSSTTKNAN